MKTINSANLGNLIDIQKFRGIFLIKFLKHLVKNDLLKQFQNRNIQFTQKVRNMIDEKHKNLCFILNKTTIKKKII